MNVRLAIVIVAMAPLLALTLPAHLLAWSFLRGGVPSIVAAGDHRSGAAAFATPPPPIR